VTTESALATPGDRIDRYEVQTLLGTGGMASVFRVRHLDLGTLHALKLLTNRSRSLGRRLLQEGRIQARLRHPNVVGVTDVVRHDGGVGLVMDYVAGVDLSWIVDHHELTLPQVDALARGLFSAVAAAHELGLVHRDLKPDNVLLERQGDELVPRVADFGLAKALREELRVAKATRPGAVMGTPQYMAPEQFRDASTVHHRADIYSLGAILYTVLAGRPLFAHDPDMAVMLRRVLTGDVPPLAQLAPDTPAAWLEVIEAALQYDIDERPASVADMAEAWAAGAPSEPVHWDEELLDTVAAARERQAPSAGEVPTVVSGPVGQASTLLLDGSSEPPPVAEPPSRWSVATVVAPVAVVGTVAALTLGMGSMGLLLWWW